MSRVKHLIITYIHSPQPSINIRRVCEMADVFSDHIVVVTSSKTSVVPANVKNAQLDPDKWNRDLAYRRMVASVPLYGEKPAVIVGLEDTWIISDPHIVRDTIEYNPGRSLLAKRYFMLPEDQYLTDGIYHPVYLPVVYPFSGSTYFRNEVDTAPAHAWTNPHVEASFDVLDYRLYNSTPDKNATIRPYEGMIPYPAERT